MSRTVAIVGAGIGGLSAALSLAQQGFAVRVLEQASALGEIGAGIQLSPNCTRVLFDLGLEAPLRAVAFYPQGGEMRSWRSGKVLSATEFGARLEAQTGFPYLHVHRADLIRVLAQAVAEHPDIDLNLGACAVGFDIEDRARVEVRDEADGAATSTTHTADVLVGADGIRSVVQAHLFGAVPPRFTGNVAWRALVPTDALPAGMVRPMATAWWGPGAHFVHYYVRGGELVNCVCVIEKSGWEIESWTERGEHAELQADFAGWHADVRTLIDRADRDALYKWALFDRSPLPSWGRGCATLLGDACHPTLPFMAQGAAMAIEDGAVLARCLQAADTPLEFESQLHKYQALRHARTARVQSGSRRNAGVFHMRGWQAWVRNLGLKIARPTGGLTSLFGYDALTAHLSS
ncbi:MAG: FAD-dependent monooxygenase [Pseudomonadota bacterium]